VVFPAVVGLVILFSPARLAVFSAANSRVGIEFLGTLAFLNKLILLAPVALVRSFGKTGLDAPQAKESLEAGAVENTPFGGIVAEPVELPQHQNFEHEHWVERRFTTLTPIECGVPGEFLEQREEALLGNDLAQFEDASAFGGDCLFEFDEAEKASSSFGLEVAAHAH
jgi:hypothetical protein